MGAYLGIDGGGSGSRWTMLDDRGEVVGCGDEGPPIQVAECGPGVAVERVAGFLHEIAVTMDSLDGATIVAGLAGVGARSMRLEMSERLAGNGDDVLIVDDCTIGATAALADGPGVAVFAGTGSFGVARSEAGTLHRIGGRGSIASDQGSGYRIVRAAAEAVVLAADGIGPATGLCDVLPAALGVDSATLIGVALMQRSTQEIARCFLEVVRTAEQGDEVARRILAEAAAWLVRLAHGAAARAGTALEDGPVTFGGGTSRSAFYFAEVATAFRTAGFRGEVQPLPRSCAAGAALLARARAQKTPPLDAWCDG